MSQFKRKLKVVFEKGSLAIAGMPQSDRLQTDRYVPKALGEGPGWLIFDRKLGRHLYDAEVKKIPLDRIENEKFVA